MTVAIERSAQMRQLGRTFAVEGKLAQTEARTDDAVRCYLDTVRFGQAMAVGGLMLERIAGDAVESLGLEGLRELRGNFSASERQQIIQALQAVDAKHEPFPELLARESAFSDAIIDNRMGIWAILVRRTTRKLLQQGAAFAETAVKRNEAILRLLMADLALHRFQLETGVLPGDLKDLVPKYLTTVPIDPFSGQPLVYRRQPSGPLIYSVGPDRQDDSGMPLKRQAGAGADVGDILVNKAKASEETSKP